MKIIELTISAKNGIALDNKQAALEILSKLDSKDLKKLAEFSKSEKARKMLHSPKLKLFI